MPVAKVSGVAWAGIAKVKGVKAGVVATGGTVSRYESGGVVYRVHTFTAGGNFVVTRGGAVDYLVVGGGGGGGKVNSQTNHAGGGGGGGLLAGNTPVSAQTYAITVGAGGAAQTTANTGGNPGGDSSFGSLVSVTGGGGGTSVAAANKNGGSGGGGSVWNAAGTGVSGPPRQGYDGGAQSGPSNSNAGGGGGAGGLGGNGDGVKVGGAGGIGVASSITGTELYYAGGGGGGGGDGTTGSSGGTGGSGVGGTGYTDGVSNIDATAGTDGRGGGGGGGADTNGAKGGDGVVIIRYPISNVLSRVSGVVDHYDATVNPGSSIQTAINNAAPGAVIFIAAGTHNTDANLTIDKPITLLGNNAGVSASSGQPRNSESILSNGSTNYIYVTSDNVTIDGFQFPSETSRTIYAPSSGVKNLKIRNNRFVTSGATEIGSSGLIQFVAGDYTGLVLADNYFYSPSGSRGYVAFYGFGASMTWDNALVERNKIENKFGGIYLFGYTTGSANNAVVRNNVISGVTRGILTAKFISGLIEGNMVTAGTGSEYGIYIASANGLTVTRNALASFVKGVMLQTAHTGVLLNYNNLNGPFATAAVSNEVDTDLNAENNWWGSASPDFGTLIQGVGAAKVDYTPYLTSALPL